MSRKVAASSTGFHFYNLYQCCPRKFYLRWYCRLEEKYVAPALIFGAAFHEGKATFYRTHSLERAKNRARIFVYKNHKYIVPGPNTVDAMAMRVSVLLGVWINTFGYRDLSNYEILFIEKEMSIMLPGGFVFTGRPDAVLRKGNNYIIMETKTSGFSKDLTEQAVRFGDQATSYIALVAKELLLGKDFNLVVQPDIAYWNSKALREDNIDCFRPEPVNRTMPQVIEFCNSVGQVYSEIAQKAAAVKAGRDPVQMFPRNTYYCMSYNKACCYADICRSCITAKSKPLGFKKAVPISIESSVLDELAIQ